MDRGKSINASDDNFGLVLNCAVRYAIGRKTYMPGCIIDYVTPLLPYVSDKTLYVFEQDVMERNYPGGFGDEKIDAPRWVDFLHAVIEEEKRRGLTQNNRV